MAAAAIAVRAGAVLRLSGCAGDGAAVVDADMGSECVYSGEAVVSVGAAQWRGAGDDIGAGAAGYLDRDL